MRRTRTERDARWVWPLVAAALLFSAPSRAQTQAERQEAHAHFDRGVALAKAKDYERALHEFEQAYALVPHPSVLYNIAQAQVALGRNAEASESFRRYLDDAGSDVSSSRRAEISTLLTQLAADSRGNEPVTPPAPTTQPAPASVDEAPAAAAVPLPAPPRPELPRAVARIQRSDRLATTVAEHHQSGARTLAYWIGGGSVILGGAAFGHYLWNRSRYEDWQDQQQAYQRFPSEERRRAANELAQSISHASVVTVALCVGASLALGSSVVLFVSSRPEPAGPRAAMPDGVVGLRGSF